jgi:hypothetical protein
MRPGNASALMVGLALLCGCSNFRAEFPRQIETEQLLAASSEGSFMSTCENEVYRLSEKTAKTLIRQGNSFLRSIDPPRHENARNPYSSWVETPVRHDGIFALYAVGGCGSAPGDSYAREIEAALRAPGSHFALTANREGMILIAPRARLAAFFYFG